MSKIALLVHAFEFSLLCILCVVCASSNAIGSLGIPGKFTDWQISTAAQLIILRNKQFLFCALPKNGCTLWKKMLLRVMGSEHWNATEGQLIHNSQMSGLEYIGLNYQDKTKRNYSDIAWLFRERKSLNLAVIVRNPITRFLSAFIDRCKDMGEWWRCGSKEPVEFEIVVAYIESQYPKGKFIKDVHFRRQVDMCGLRHMTYNLVGYQETYYEDSRSILQKVGLWEKFGKSGWGPSGKHEFGSVFDNTSNHRMAEHDTANIVCSYYTPDLLRRVYELYKPDFHAFGYEIDEWRDRCAKHWLQEEGAPWSKRNPAQLVAVVSTQRGASTTIAETIGDHPCAVSLNELMTHSLLPEGYDKYKWQQQDGSLDRNALSNYLHLNFKRFEPDHELEYARIARKQYCDSRPPMVVRACGNVCVVALKIQLNQKEYQPSWLKFIADEDVRTIVVERDTEKAYCSIERAKACHDWGHTPETHVRTSCLKGFVCSLSPAWITMVRERFKAARNALKLAKRSYLELEFLSWTTNTSDAETRVLDTVGLVQPPPMWRDTCPYEWCRKFKWPDDYYGNQ